MPQISLTGTFRTSPDQLARIAALLADHIRLTRAEPGCLSFQVTPSATDPCTFHVAERFTDRAAFQAHQDRVAISAWGVGTAGMARAYTVREIPQ